MAQFADEVQRTAQGENLVVPMIADLHPRPAPSALTILRLQNHPLEDRVRRPLVSHDGSLPRQSHRIYRPIPAATLALLRAVEKK
jgi:hypothetical protein